MPLHLCDCYQWESEENTRIIEEEALRQADYDIIDKLYLTPFLYLIVGMYACVFLYLIVEGIKEYLSSQSEKKKSRKQENSAAMVELEKGLLNIKRDEKGIECHEGCRRIHPAVGKV